MHPLAEWLHAELAEPQGPSFVVAPSAGAAEALRSAVLELRDAALGVQFTTVSGLARRILMLLGKAAPRELDPLEERELLRVQVAPGGPLADALRFPASLAAVHAATRELARALPAADEITRLSPTGRELARLELPASAMLLALQALRESGGSPLAGTRIRLVGLARLDRLQAELLRRLPLAGAELVAAPDRGRAPVRRERHSAHSFATELRLAARLCLDARGRGIGFSRMLVVAPALGPYVPHVAGAFAAEGVPFRAQATTPLAHEPRGALLVHAARVLFGAAERASWLALLASPLRRTPLDPGVLAQLDRLSRRGAWSGRGARTAGLAAQLPELGSVADRAAAPAADPAERTAALRGALDALLAPAVPGTRDAAAAEACRACLLRLDALQRVAGSLTDADFVRELDALAAGEGLVLASEPAPQDGVAIVELDQAFAFPAQHVHLLGLAAPLVPGPGPDESYLAAEDREAVAGLASRRAARQRERAMLLALPRHAATSFVLSRPRHDRDGRECPAAHWHGAVWAAAGGVPSDADASEPSHPLDRARGRVALGACPPDQALVVLALSDAEPEEIEPLLPRDWRHVPAAAQGLEGFDPTRLARDAVVLEALAARASDPITVSRLEMLAGCPQRFLFTSLIRMEPLEPVPDLLALPHNVLGSAVHEALRKAFAEHAGDLEAAADPRPLARAIAAAAGDELERQLERTAPGIGEEHASVRAALVASWRAALFAAVAADLGRMAEDGSRPVAFELALAGTLEVVGKRGDARALRLTGRADRVDRLAPASAGRLRVVDYKTGRNAALVVMPAEILPGRSLQLVLYPRLLGELGTASEAQIRAVRPQPGSPPEPPPGAGPARADQADAEPTAVEPLASWLPGGQWAAEVDDTLAALQALRDDGLFPMRRESASCGFCQWRIACRRLHAPSVERVERSTLFERYLAVAKKNARTLAADEPGEAEP